MWARLRRHAMHTRRPNSRDKTRPHANGRHVDVKWESKGVRHVKSETLGRGASLKIGLSIAFLYSAGLSNHSRPSGATTHCAASEADERARIQCRHKISANTRYHKNGFAGDPGEVFFSCTFTVASSHIAVVR